MNGKLCLASLFAMVHSFASATSQSPKVADAMRQPELRNVKLQGSLAAKMNSFLNGRILDRQGWDNVFSEARSAYVLRNDDENAKVGLWRGEFWGKSMMSAARVADYFNDEGLRSRICEEARKLIATGDADGYVGSYSVATNCFAKQDDSINWNVWSRKYAIWGMYLAYRSTGDDALFASSVLQLNQLIDMLHGNGINIAETGPYWLNGMPSMSILKPVLMIYRDCGNEKFLHFAEEIVRGWDREDGVAPNFFRNANRPIPLNQWYPQPQRWAKTYEMLSCLDGLLEYYRVTGDSRSLDTVILLRDNIMRHESNQIGGIGIFDRLVGAESLPIASTEVCDITHWIRLNVDLYLITGDDRYLDSVELSYYNCFMASIYRGIGWTPLNVRDAGRHRFSNGQCGYVYNHCCVDNAARTFMDIASIAVTRDRQGVFHVNHYQDATMEMDGVKFAITGDYPAHGEVNVVVEGEVDVKFRKPSWCPRLDVEKQSANGKTTYLLHFDMNPRIQERELVCRNDSDSAQVIKAAENRHYYKEDDDLRKTEPKSPYATVHYGPLILARSARLNLSESEIVGGESINGKGYAVTLRRMNFENVYAPFEAEFSKTGKPTRKVKVCSFESAGDAPVARPVYYFSIRF